MNNSDPLKPMTRILRIVAITGLLLFAISLIQRTVHNGVILHLNERSQSTFAQLAEQVDNDGLSVLDSGKVADSVSILGGNANVIVTEHTSNRILYKLNERYLPETDTFTVAGNPGSFLNSPMFIMDRNHEVRYRVRLVQPMRGLFFAEKGSGDFQAEDGIFFPDSVDLHMRMSAIGSKDWQLFIVYKPIQPEKRYALLAFTTLLNNRFFYPGAWICLAVFWLLLPLWVYADASRRRLHAPAWSLVILLTNVAGLAVYVSIRPQGKLYNETDRQVCRTCFQETERRWSYCPHCGETLTDEHKQRET